MNVCVERDALAFGQGFFCVEDGVQRCVAGVDEGADVVNVIAQAVDVLPQAGIIVGIQVAFQNN